MLDASNFRALVGGTIQGFSKKTGCQFLCCPVVPFHTSTGVYIKDVDADENCDVVGAYFLKIKTFQNA